MKNKEKTRKFDRFNLILFVIAFGIVLYAIVEVLEGLCIWQNILG